MTLFLYDKVTKLSDIISIRWVASDYHAMKSIHSMWQALINDLSAIGKENTVFELKTREKAKKLVTKLTGNFFLVMFYFIFDILNELAIISQNMQRREGLVIDIQTLKKIIDSILSYIYKV